jgi:hypothetical protein
MEHITTRAVSVNTQTTTATTSPGIQPPSAAVHHNTSFHIVNYNPKTSRVRSHTYTLQIDMTVNNLLIPPDDPQGHPFKITRKPGPAYPPMAI